MKATKRKINRTKKYTKKRKYSRKNIKKGGKPLQTLFTAIRKQGDTLEEVRALIDKLRQNSGYTAEVIRDTINERDPRTGRTALEQAYWAGKKNIFDYLLDLGAIDSGDETGTKILNLAMMHGNPIIVWKLLEQNASLLTREDLEQAASLYKPTGDDNVNSRYSNNMIVKKIAKKLSEQGDLPHVNPLSDPTKRVSAVQVDSEPYDDHEHQLYSFPGEADAVLFNDEGDVMLERGNGVDAAYPIDIPEAKPFRRGVFDLSNPPDPDATSVFTGAPLPLEMGIKRLIRGRSNPYSEEEAPVFLSERVDVEGEEPPQTATRFGGSSKRKKGRGRR